MNWRCWLGIHKWTGFLLWRRCERCGKRDTSIYGEAA